MSIKSISRLGDWLDRVEVRAVNRTGSTLAEGDIVILDLTGSDGDVDTLAEHLADTTPDAKASPLANVINVGAAHDDGWIFLVATGAIADNAEGKFVLRGLCKVKLVGSNAVSIGGRISPTSGQTYASAEGDGLAVVGIAMEAGPSGSDPATKNCIFDGWSFAGPQAKVS